jgi:hypothetical protein
MVIPMMSGGVPEDARYEEKLEEEAADERR